MSPPNHLLPFAHNQSRPANELALSTKYVPSSTTRKRDFPTSDSLDDQWPSSDVSHYDFGADEEDSRKAQHVKRFHQFTSDFDEKLWEMPASSPPPPSTFDPDDTIDADMTVDDDEEEAGVKLSQVKGNWLLGKDFMTSSISKAQTIIQSSIDEGKPEVTLDDLQLTSVPDEISDLKDLVILHDNDSLVPKIKIFLSNNQISVMAPPIFEVRNITVLSLRNNELAEIPPAIARLENLVELSIGGNSLEYLPVELLSLKKLTNLSIHPNPFKVPEGEAEEADNNGDDVPSSNVSLRQRLYTIPPFSDLKTTLSSPNVDSLVQPTQRYFVSVHLHDHFAEFANPKTLQPGEGTAVASLTEQALRVLGQHDRLSERERRRLNLNSHFEVLLDKAITAYETGKICGVCSAATTIGVGHSFEWWDGIKGNRAVVFKRTFCSLACYRAWERQARLELGPGP